MLIKQAKTSRLSSAKSFILNQNRNRFDFMETQALDDLDADSNFPTDFEFDKIYQQFKTLYETKEELKNQIANLKSEQPLGTASAELEELNENLIGASEDSDQWLSALLKALEPICRAMFRSDQAGHFDDSYQLATFVFWEKLNSNKYDFRSSNELKGFFRTTIGNKIIDAVRKTKRGFQSISTEQIETSSLGVGASASSAPASESQFRLPDFPTHVLELSASDLTMDFEKPWHRDYFLFVGGVWLKDNSQAYKISRMQAKRWPGAFDRRNCATAEACERGIIPVKNSQSNERDKASRLNNIKQTIPRKYWKLFQVQEFWEYAIDNSSLLPASSLEESLAKDDREKSFREELRDSFCSGDFCSTVAALVTGGFVFHRLSHDWFGQLRQFGFDFIDNDKWTFLQASQFGRDVVEHDLSPAVSKLNVNHNDYWEKLALAFDYATAAQVQFAWDKWKERYSDLLIFCLKEKAFSKSMSFLGYVNFPQAARVGYPFSKEKPHPEILTRAN